MHNFQAAQPALLYLSPACILSVTGCAWVRGELPLLWAYDDGEHDTKERGAKVEKKEVAAGDEPEPDSEATAVSSAVGEKDSLKSRGKQ